MSSLQSWVSGHKLTSVGTLWASAVVASLACARGRTPFLKPSLRLIHARLHAQALTLAALSGVAVVGCCGVVDGAAEGEGNALVLSPPFFDPTAE